MDRKLKRKSDVGETYENTPSRKVKQEELEVTGVSRSGRVRKKSSKLMDFESPDEIDIRNNVRKKEKLDFNSPNISRTVKKLGVQMKQEMTSDDEDTEGPISYPVKEEHFTDESEQDMSYAHDESSLDSMGSDIDDIDDGDIDRDEAEGFQPIAEELHDDSPGQAKSLYMLEKSNKKKLVIKDGKIVGRTKAQRKDKGKTRFTAYMLWAKEVRQELMRSKPELDFSQTSKKLGELWASVPFNEKYIWKRRAKRLGALGSVRSSQPPPGGQLAGGGTGAAGASVTPPTAESGKKMKSPPAGRKFINKQVLQASSGGTPVPSSPSSVQSTLQLASVTSPVVSPSSADTKSGGKQGQEVVSQTVFKPVGTTPLDVAAHLRLLGESLVIIGERLTEHEGQITVSGSFSVLLDSLLCALVPLLCLTQQVVALNVIPQEQLSQTMDNIAYIMPGL